MKKLIFIYFTYLGLGITQAQNIIPPKNKTYTFGILQNYYQDVNKIAIIPGFQLTKEKNKYLLIYQFLPAQLLDEEFGKPCDRVRIPFARIYNSISTNFYLFRNEKILISGGPNFRFLLALHYIACFDKGFWQEPIEQLKVGLEPGLNTNLLYFPFSGKKLSKIGFSANINLMAFGANTYQMGVCYKHISKKPLKKSKFSY